MLKLRSRRRGDGALQRPDVAELKCALEAVAEGDIPVLVTALEICTKMARE